MPVRCIEWNDIESMRIIDDVRRCIIYLLATLRRGLTDRASDTDSLRDAGLSVFVGDGICSRDAPSYALL